MLTLHEYVADTKRPDPSAFCAKVQLFLKMNNISYDAKKGNPTKAPKGKLPVITDGDKIIADSDVIISYLCKKYKIDPDAHLSREEKAISFMIRKTMEEHYYFIMLHTRWIDPKGWAVAKPLFFSDLPKPLQLFVPDIVRRQVRGSLHGQGIGRHEQEEIDRRGIEVLDHLKVFVGQSDYLFGNKPSLADCTVFPYLWGAIHWPSESELKTAVMNHPPFLQYVDRIVTRYFQAN